MKNIGDMLRGEDVLRMNLGCAALESQSNKQHSTCGDE